MLKYIIQGGNKLEGEVEISGSKNASLPIIAASILNEGKKQGRIEGEKISKIKIVKNMINIKMDDQAIIEITGIDKQELEKLKNEEALVS